MRRLGSGLVLLAAVAATTALAGPFAWHLPPGVAPPPVPADNPMSAAKVELGRRLFYDADLSIDGTTACATCHEQHRAFTEGNATHPGVGGTPGRRNVMGLANVAYFDPLTWADPRQHRLEAQALVPLLGTHPVEMGMQGKSGELARRLGADSCYRTMFAAAFPQTAGRIDLGNITKAVAAFERTLLSFNAPYDRYLRGDRAALSDSARRGAELFSVGCTGCHRGPNFTDGKFHVFHLHREKKDDPARDRGLAEITGAGKDNDAFRTPSLRNVALTAPYMHDGSVPDLADAVRAHAGVTAKERDVPDLVAFLESLSDRDFVTDPDFALPKTACGKPL
jgi:cytochrome c peroxidase